jgi:hypothetical protein
MFTVGVYGHTKPFVLSSGASNGLAEYAGCDGIDNLTRQSPALGKFACVISPLLVPLINPSKDLVVLSVLPILPDWISEARRWVVLNPVETVLAVCDTVFNTLLNDIMFSYTLFS